MGGDGIGKGKIGVSHMIFKLPCYHQKNKQAPASQASEPS